MQFQAQVSGSARPPPRISNRIVRHFRRKSPTWKGTSMSRTFIIGSASRMCV